MRRRCVRFKAVVNAGPRIDSGYSSAISWLVGAGDPTVRAMSNHVPLHLFEIVFYSTAALLTAIGVAWVWLH
jgi:hypothetical protein